MNIPLIVTIVVSVIAFGFVGLGFRKGFKRAFLKSTLSIVMTILALITALIVAKMVAAPLAEIVWPMVEEALGPDFVSILESSPSLKTFAASLPIALVAPILFPFLFFILNLLYKIPYAIIRRVIKIKGERVFDKPVFGKTGGKLLGGVIGAAAGCIVLMAYLVPLTGYLNFAASTLSAIPTDAPIATVEQSSEKTDLDLLAAEIPTNDPLAMIEFLNTEYITPISQNPVFTAASVIGGNALFDSLTSVSINDVEVSVFGELGGLVKTAVKLEPMLGKDIKDFGEEQSNALKNVVKDIETSNILKNIFSEVLSCAATNWKDGKSFAGMQSPVSEDTSPLIEPLMTDLLDILSTSNPQNIVSDLYTISDIFAALATHDTFAILGGDMDTAQLIQALSSDGLLSDILSAFKANEHMETLIPTVVNMGMSAIGEAMGLPENDEAVYDSLMTDVTDVINEALAKEDLTERTDFVKTEIKEAMAAYGMEMSDSNAEFYASCIITDFVPGETYTEEDIIGYFAEIAEYLAQNTDATEPVFSSATSDLEFLFGAEASVELLASEKNSSKKVSFTKPEKAPELSADEISAITKTATQLSGKEPLAHSLVTVDSLKMSKEDAKSMTVEDIKTDGALISNSLSTIADVLDILTPSTPENPDDEGSSEGGFSLDTVSKLNEAGLGTALSNLASTALFNNSAPKLLVGALQTAGVVLPKEETEDIINTIKEDSLANRENVNNQKPDDSEEPSTPSAPTVIESLVNSAANISALMTQIQNEEMSEEELVECLDKVFAGLNKNTAKVISGFVKGSLITKYAPSMEKEEADACAALIKAVFDEISSSESTDFSSESALMSDLLHIAIKAKDSEADNLFNDAQGNIGKIDSTADAFLKKILKSDIIAVAVKKADLGDDPFGATDSMSDADVAEFIAAANKVMAEDASMRKNSGKVIDMAAVVGIKLTYSETTFTFTQVVAK